MGELPLILPGCETAGFELLKTWVGGFSRNNKGPYLDSGMARLILFPKAQPTAVVGYVPGPSEEVPLEEEEALLNPPEAM